MPHLLETYLLLDVVNAVELGLVSVKDLGNCSALFVVAGSCCIGLVPPDGFSIAVLADH